MTVKDLIQRLSIEDQEMRIVVDGYETGYDEVDKIHCVKGVPNHNKKEWEGEFDEVIDENLSENLEIFLLFPRKS